ncbi:MAG: glycerol-3-phosphate 1-O-acyltransferase PlsY [Deltaproteobacteria bacterium]|nr:glycerol-3-phosphate 1-O-acyltransferase PlsY [Deltaproteobacteria bacterium]
MGCLFWVIIAYLVGSLPFGLWIGLARGVDVRGQGSGNIGTTNVGRSLGKPWALLVLLLDATKGYLPVMLALHGACSPVWVALTMVSAVLGHVFSLYLHFRGGKGVATALGVVGAVHWPAALWGLGVYLVVLAVGRVSSLGSLFGVVAAMLVLAFGDSLQAYSWAMLIITALIFWRHKDNLRRLRRGEER